jgi:phosphoribosylformimino-5-aminoimidazole carboxamide ribotide isomerase
VSAFQPIPAVDIRGGRCVRLKQGDFLRETTYADDPVEMARHWVDEGAGRLHVVDLDGARDGVRQNAEVIRRLIAAVPAVPVQVGGGVRSIDSARALLEDGADRVIVGTAAVEHGPVVVGEWLRELEAARVIVGVDARGGRIATRGWQSTTSLDVVEFCRALADIGVERVLYTDVERDGLLGGPNVETTRRVAEVVAVIGSGGVGNLDHVRELARAGAEGAIIGTALYDGRLALRDLLEVAAAC